MFSELLAEQDNKIAAFLILYMAFDCALKNKDSIRAKKLESKIELAWSHFEEEKKEMILEKLIKDGHYPKEAIEMVRTFRGKILSII